MTQISAKDQTPATAAELRDEMRAEVRRLRKINANLLDLLKRAEDILSDLPGPDVEVDSVRRQIDAAIRRGPSDD